MFRIAVVVIALLAMAAGVYLSARHPTPEPVTAGTKQLVVGELRPDFRLGSTTGSFISAADFPGKVLLINFWATWCAPCRKEMPMLMALQEQNAAAGLQIIGIALDDMQNVRDFILELGIEYPILVGEGDVMQTNHDYGNLTGTLPYSVLVDRDGIIRWQYTGEIRRGEITQLLKEYL